MNIPDSIDKLPNVGWLVILILGLVIAVFVYRLFTKHGGKFVFLGQTIEVDQDGKTQAIDTLGLTYIMKESCDKIQALTEERLEDILPDISYLLREISPLFCCMYRAEAILNKRLLKNGFEDLTAVAVDNYIMQLTAELFTHLQHEVSRARLCSREESGTIDKAKIELIAKDFTRRAVRVYLLEVKSKAEMYETYLPLFEKLGDTIRAGFCTEKKEKKVRQTEALRDVLRKLNA